MSSSTSSARTAFVYIYLEKEGYVPVGRLQYFPESKSSRFEYGSKYHQRPGAIPLDPVTMPLGQLAPVDTRPDAMLHNVFFDAAPDKWGRRVISFLAGDQADTLSEFDLLTAAHSEGRIGALAFGPDSSSGPRSMAPWCQGEIFKRTVDDLSRIALVIREIDSREDEELVDLRARLPKDHLLQALVYSVVTVGGGRPKAMIDYEGADWIAKFPKRGDIWNDPRVEHATMTLAANCGISTAETKIITVDDVDVLLARRFDRNESGKPRHIITGFTLRNLSLTGNWGSYQNLSEAARRYGDDQAGPELFRRMIFNICCANTDDHPKNHAFFVSRDKVQLTPAYDVVPQKIFSDSLALVCGKQQRRATLENAISWAGPFGLRAKKAGDMLHEMIKVARGWREHFEHCGVSGGDIDKLEPRFAQIPSEELKLQRIIRNATSLSR